MRSSAPRAWLFVGVFGSFVLVGGCSGSAATTALPTTAASTSSAVSRSIPPVATPTPLSSSAIARASPTTTPPVATVVPTSAPTHAPTPAATAVGQPSPTPLSACLPLCVPPAIAAPGPLQPGDYRTQYFFGGQLTVTLADDGWSADEDSTSELKLSRGDLGAIEFWMDVTPIQDPTTIAIPGFDGTAKWVVDWIAHDSQVKVVSREAATIAGLPAELVVYDPAPDAKNKESDCPAELQPCIGQFNFEQWDGIFTSGGPFRNGLYAADVSWSASNHAIYAMVWANTVDDYNVLAPLAAPIVNSAQLPAQLQPAT